MSETVTEIDQMTEIMVDEAMKELKRALEITDIEKQKEEINKITEMITTHIKMCIELDKAKKSLQG